MGFRSGSVIETKIKIGGEVSPSVKSSFDQISEFANKLQPSFDKIVDLGKGTALGLAASVGLGATSFMEYDDAVRQLQASTGCLTDSSVDLSEVMKEVYGNNFGTSWEDVGTSIDSVNKNIGGTQEQLVKATQNALAFKDTFGYEVSESTRAASTMMKQFGIDANQAYNLMAQGEQNGLDYSGELIDSINEYSVQFNKLGLGASDMFNIFNGGMMDGAWNLDKIGDAVKEFSIRAIDGSKTTIEGFTKLNLNADDMAKKFASGGDTARDAFIQVTDAIGKMNDPVEQSIVGVDLFGTMWEDLGPKVISQMGNIGDEFDENIETMQKLNNIKYTSFSSGLEGIKRQIETAIIPLGESLVPVMNDFANWFLSVGAPKIQEFADNISNFLPGAIQVASGAFSLFIPVLDLLIDSLPEVISVITGLSSAFMALKVIGTVTSVFSKASAVFSKLSLAFSAVSGGAATLGEGLALVMGPVGWIALGIGTVITVLTLLYMKCEPFREFVNNLFSSIATWISGSLVPQLQGIIVKIGALWNAFSSFAMWIGSALSPVFIFVFTFIGSIISTFVSTIGGLITSLLTIFGGIIDFVTGVFAGNWSAAWEGVKSIFSGIFSGIYEIAATPINAIIGLINSAIAGINTLGFDIQSIPSVPNFSDIGGGGSTDASPVGDMPQFASGGFTDIPSICGEDGPEAVIPLRRNNPRSLSLLKSTASAIGAESSGGSGSIQFVYSPVISGNVDSNTLVALENEFNNFKEKVLQVLEDEGRLDYA